MLLFSINPPISAHALLSGNFGSVTSRTLGVKNKPEVE
jgi:hypothetical protein